MPRARRRQRSRSTIRRRETPHRHRAASSGRGRATPTGLRPAGPASASPARRKKASRSVAASSLRRMIRVLAAAAASARRRRHTPAKGTSCPRPPVENGERGAGAERGLGFASRSVAARPRRKRREMPVGEADSWLWPWRSLADGGAFASKKHLKPPQVSCFKDVR